MHCQDVRAGGGLCDRGEVAIQVVARLIDHAIYHEAGGQHHQGVAIGCRDGRQFGGDAATSPRTIVDHHALPEALRHRCGDQP